MPSPFDAPAVDWGALTRIPLMWGEGKEHRRKEDLLTRAQRLEQARREVLAQPGDFSAKVNELATIGDLEGASDLAGIAKSLQPEAMTPYQSEFLRLKALEVGQKVPPAPKVESGFDEHGREVKREWTGSEWRQVGGAKSAAQSLTAVDKKEIIEGDETVQAVDAASSLLDQALEVNSKAYSGPLAGTRGYATSLFGNESGKATQDLENIVIGNALAQLKAVFGGMPTEGERKILIDLQGSVNQAPEVREKIFTRAKAALAARKNFAQKQSGALRSGTYYQPGGMATPEQPPLPTPDPQAAPPPQTMPGAPSNPRSSGPATTLPPKAQLQVGQVYPLPSGQQGLWTGQGFEVLN